jgi:hypothetical protein
MDLIKSYSLVKSQNCYDLVLYFDVGTMDTEFSSEFGEFAELGELNKDSNSLNQSILQSISEKFPDIEISTVKIMVGTVLLSSFVLTPSPSIQIKNIT